MNNSIQFPRDRTNGELDAAVIAYRVNPTAENERRVLDAADAHNTAFLHEQTDDYISHQGSK